MKILWLILDTLIGIMAIINLINQDMPHAILNTALFCFFGILLRLEHLEDKLK